MKHTCIRKIEKPVILAVIDKEEKKDEKVYISFEFVYEASVPSKELENRIAHTIEMEMPMVCCMKYALGISKEDIIQSKMDIDEDMMNRVKWSFDDECKLVSFKVVEVSIGLQEKVSLIKWLCTCGSVNDSKFCPKCGKEKSLERWICICGQVNIGKFCTRCGSSRDL